MPLFIKLMVFVKPNLEQLAVDKRLAVSWHYIQTFQMAAATML
jgi:hypothetical protein